MRTRFRTLLVDNKDFDIDKVKKQGSFLGKKFWIANLLWGSQDSLSANLAATAKTIKN